jgi:hypothetical protein
VPTQSVINQAASVVKSASNGGVFVQPTTLEAVPPLMPKAVVAGLLQSSHPAKAPDKARNPSFCREVIRHYQQLVKATPEVTAIPNLLIAV